MNQINFVMSLALAGVGLGSDVEKLSHEMSKRATDIVKEFKEEEEREMEAMRQLSR